MPPCTVKGVKGMNKIKSVADVRQQISKIIVREIEKTKKEISEFEQKIHDNEVYYGFGGWYTQYEKAKDRRERLLKELEALKKTQGQFTVLDNVTMYAYYCNRCAIKVLLSSKYGEKVYCPVCEMPIYESSECEVMKIERGSRRAVLKNGQEAILNSNGKISE